MALCIWGKYSCVKSQYYDTGWQSCNYASFIPVGYTSACYSESDVFFSSATGFSCTNPIPNFSVTNPPSGTAVVSVQPTDVRSGVVYGELSYGHVDYRYSRQRSAYRNDIQGPYLTTITAETNTYPQNGRHTDGYWYVYQGLANKAPTISGTDTNLGTLTELEYKYSINDTDPSDTITVFERLDGTQLRTFTATRDIEYTIKPIWQEVLNGTHTLTITATDNIGASTVRTITFAKAEHELEFTLQTPLPADDMVTKTIMSITREIPAGAVMQIYVCNNGFDEIPTWEDITAKVVDGEKFFFANTVKTAAEWGYNIKICVQRLGADVGDTIFITSVGGNYE